MFRNLEDLKSGTGLDKPKFKAQGVEMGAVDIKLNHLGNRLALSSMDSSLKIFNLHQESGLALYKDLDFTGSISNVWKIDFNPNGSDILTGTLAL